MRQGAIDKGEDPSIVDEAIRVDARRREALGGADGLRAERNTVSEQIGAAIRRRGRPERTRGGGLARAVDPVGSRSKSSMPW